MSPVRVTKMRWDFVRENLLLILTFSGVICGVGLGKHQSLSSFQLYLSIYYLVIVLIIIKK